jgi:hypothetical protein
MYTDEMKRAVHSIAAPKGFGLDIIEHNTEGITWIELVADEIKFMKLLDQDKRSAVEYMVRVKSALEDNGAIVQLTRRAIKQ